MKQFMPVIIVFLIVGIAAAFFIFSNQDSSSQESSEERTVTREQNTLDDTQVLVIGNPEAPATLVEYFDYKCPACNQFHNTIAKDIERDYVAPGLANFEIRITPVIGPDSANAARGAYCANDQGLFESYHNTVLDFMRDNYYAQGNIAAEFEDILTTDQLVEIVTPLGIEPEDFRKCVDSARYNSNLDTNLEAAADDSVRGTPGFAIGEQSFVGGQPYTVFQTLLDIELQ